MMRYILSHEATNEKSMGYVGIYILQRVDWCAWYRVLYRVLYQRY